MSKIKLVGYHATVVSLVMLLGSSYGNPINDEAVIKIGNHFFKESGKYRPLSNGLLFDRFSIISVNDKNDFRFIKCSIKNEKYRIFKVPAENANIWASGSVGDIGVGVGMPFVWMSKRVESNYLSIDYFYAWQIHLKIIEVGDNSSNDADIAIIIPKPSTEPDSVLFLPHSIEAEKLSFTVVPGEYLLLLVQQELVGDNSRFNVVAQRELKVIHPDPGSLDEVFVEKLFTDLNKSSYTAKDIIQSSPWLMIPNGIKEVDRMVFEINPETVKAFNLCE